MQPRLAANVIAALLGGALLAGCGGSPSEESAPIAEATSAQIEAPEEVAPEEAEGDGDVAAADPIGPGAYQFDYMGAAGNIEIPLSVEDPAVADLEAYRKLTGSDGVGYARVVIDNTAGTEDINLYQVIAVTSAGEQVEFTGLDEAISTWRDRLPEEDVDGYNRGVDLVNDNQVFVLPGAKSTAILINPEPVSDVSRLFAYPAGGFDRVEAYKVR